MTVIGAIPATHPVMRPIARGANGVLPFGTFTRPNSAMKLSPVRRSFSAIVRLQPVGGVA